MCYSGNKRVKKLLVLGFLLLACMPASNFAAAESGRETRVIRQHAIRTGDMQAVQGVINDLGGINVPHDKNKGWTCLMEAAHYGTQNVVKYCLGSIYI